MLSMAPWFMAWMASSMQHRITAAQKVLLLIGKMTGWLTEKIFSTMLNWKTAFSNYRWSYREKVKCVLCVWSPFNFSQIKVFNWMLKPSKKPKTIDMVHCTLRSLNIEIILNAIDLLLNGKIFGLNDSIRFECNSIGVCPRSRCYLCCGGVCQCVIKSFEPNKYFLRFSIYYWSLL